jgi:ribonuclease HII
VKLKLRLLLLRAQKLLQKSKLKKSAKSKDPAPTLKFEVEAGFPFKAIAGVDEVGRGCLAGPVVAAACILPAHWNLPLEQLFELHPQIAEITDSKKLDHKTRARLSPWIQSEVQCFAVASASVEEIDQINIFHASHLAMERAVSALTLKAEHVLVDGKFLPKNWGGHPSHAVKATAIIQGDLHSLSIACASIIAKVHRDEWMEKLHAEYPDYGFADHKGYATPSHKKALISQGPCILHRRSFAPVRELLLQKSGAYEAQPEFAFEAAVET